MRNFGTHLHIQLWTKLYIRFALFPSKMAFFKRVWWKANVLSHTWGVGSTLPLIRHLKWGTLCLWTPTGSKMASCQSYKNEKTFVLELKRTFFFSIVQLWQLVFLEPLGVRESNVPHFKGIISANLNPRAHGRDGTFTFCHALLKKAILHL